MPHIYTHLHQLWLKTLKITQQSNVFAYYIAEKVHEVTIVEQPMINIFVLGFVCLLGLFLVLVELHSLNSTLKELVKAVRMGRKPGVVFPVFEDGENDMLKFYLALPAKSAPDVVARELTVALAGNEPVVYTLDADAVATDELVGFDNDAVVGSLVDIDDAGNRSAPSEFSFVLTDTIPPPVPGAVGLVVTDEVADPEPEPEVPVEPTPETPETPEG